MRAKPRIPLLAKVLGWLMLHLLLLALAFFLFVRWQLGLGLDSLLSGAAGDRLTRFGEMAVAEITERPASEWDRAIQALAKEHHVEARLIGPRPERVEGLPANVVEKMRSTAPPPARLPGRPDGPRMRPGPPGGPGRARERGPDDDGPPPEGPLDFEPGRPREAPAIRPLFLVRGDGGDGYWAGVRLYVEAEVRPANRKPLLLIRADRLDGSGMFFDFKPWLLGGIAVLLLSLAFWTPFVWGITRYIRKLTAAADRIASGNFAIAIPARGNDELGNLGHTLEGMATRLDHLISGQKRFLGDAAHELCAPLARIRTGLGVLEMKLGESGADLESIEADTAELAALVNEILAFSRAGNREPSCQWIELEGFLPEIVERERGGLHIELKIAPGARAYADPLLLGRSVGNLIRNAAIHAGSEARVTIVAGGDDRTTTLRVTDDGPGVPAEELPRLFEPFYRIDRSRSRDTGGSGLGLSIVRSAIETCGGTVSASLPPGGGFSITVSIPKPGAAESLRRP